jgi:NAD+ kinase
MAPHMAPVVADVLERMARAGIEPLPATGLAEWLAAHGQPTGLRAIGAVGDARDLDVCVSLGGDGTLLDSVALVGRAGIPVLGINLGRLGFLSSVRLEELDEALRALRFGRYALQDRSLLQVDGHEGLLGDADFALNEVSLHKRDTSSLIAIHVHLDDAYLNTYWADGLIIATPTGSTAYSLSCGGPVVYPTSDALVITPISPHNLNARPFVVPDHHRIRLQLEARSDLCLLNLDARSHTIDGQGTVQIKRADFQVRMVQLEGRDFLQTLREKLNWGLDARSTGREG